MLASTPARCDRDYGAKGFYAKLAIHSFTNQINFSFVGIIDFVESELIMVKYRVAVAFILMLLAVTLVSCSSVAEAKPPSYTAAQVEEIQTYAAEVSELRDRLPELAELIQAENWTFARNFIHGPLGELRTKMAYISRSLLPTEQAKAREQANEAFKSLVAIDAAAEKKDYKAAIRNFGKTVESLDAFLELVPEG